MFISLKTRTSYQSESTKEKKEIITRNFGRN